MGDILNSNIYDKLKESGLKIYDNETEGIEIKIHPHYHNNTGFFHCFMDECEFIILKGQYQDNIRNIKGRHNLSNAEISELIDTIFKAETITLSTLYMEVYLLEDKCLFKKAEIFNVEPLNDDKRDYTIPRPLTSAECAEPKSRIYDEEIILSNTYFGSYFPQVSSYFSFSIFNELLDILNPIFISCNLKTSSPSIVPAYGRLFINMTGFEKMMHTIGLNRSLYRRSYAPNLFLKMGLSKMDKINRHFFPVTYNEIEDVLNNIKENTASIDASMVTNKSFYDFIVQLMIVYEYLTIEFTSNLSILLKKFPNISLILNAVYKTRKNSIFYKDKEFNFPRYIDFAAPMEKVTFNMEEKVEKLSLHFKRFSIFTRKGKLKKAVKNMHKLLDLRDDLFITTAKFIENTKIALKNIAEIGISNERLFSENDVYFLDHDEIRRLLSNTLFGDTKDLITFRKWRNERFAALSCPPEIYGYDLADVAHIAEDMIIKGQQQEAYKVYGLNRIECSGKIETNLNLDDYTDKMIAAYNLPVTKLNNYKNAKGFLIENVSPFSHAAEFAVLNNIPLWTGHRFSALYLKNVAIEKNTLFQIDE